MTTDFNTCLVPYCRYNRGFRFGAAGAEKVRGMVLLCGEAHRDVEVAQADIEGVAKFAFDVEFFEDDFPAFFHFGFVFAKFFVFDFEGAARAAECQTRDIYGGAAIWRRSRWAAFLVGTVIEVGVDEFTVSRDFNFGC